MPVAPSPLPRLLPLFLLAILALTAMPIGSGPPTSSAPSHNGFLATAVPSASSGCAGPFVGTQYIGRVVDAPSGPSAPSVANVSVNLSYSYAQTFQNYSGGKPLTTCVPAEKSRLTNASGGFDMTANLPTDFCYHPVGCWTYTGPYGPVSVSLANGSLPAGDYLSERGPLGNLTLERIVALSSAPVDPAGPLTVSDYAPTALTADPRSGDGNQSPARVTYNWTLSGTGWSTVGPSDAPTFIVSAVPGAGLAVLRSYVNGSFGGAAFHLAPTTVVFAAAATAVTSGGDVPTLVDAGTPVEFALYGTGAAGYAYTAAYHPGLSEPNVTVACVNTTQSNQIQSFDCPLEETYESAGTAQPAATVSNGYSSATFAFASVAVSGSLEIAVSPDPVLAYVNAPVPITVRAVNNTGTQPFGPACVAPGNAPFDCDNGTGPSWGFLFEYSHIGNFTAIASLLDSGATNRSVEVPVRIVDRPTLAPVTLSPSAIPIGGATEAVATLSGGAGAMAYWWNSSAPDSSAPGPTLAAGEVPADGVINATLSGTEIGTFTITLTVVDQLGTRTVSNGTLVVDSTNVSAIELASSPDPAPGVAGAPFALRFQAVDVLGHVNPGFVGPVTLRTSPADASAVFANSTTDGPGTGSGGSFGFAGRAWNDGVLNVSFTDLTAGSVELSVDAGSSIVGPPPITLLVTADPYHEVLSSPSASVSTADSSATRYAIRDRFGNSLAGGWVDVRTVFGSAKHDAHSPIFVAGGASFVWVNYTWMAGAAGTVFVLSEANETLLPPIEVRAAATGLVPWTFAAGLAIAVAAAGALAAVVVRRRARGTAPVVAAPLAGGESEVEDGLKRLAEGRAHVLERVPFDRAVDLDAIADGFAGPPPDAAELAEWVGALVTEGVLKASIGSDGRPRFTQVAPPSERPAPRVEVDPLALDAALERRRLEEAGAEDRETRD